MRFKRLWAMFAARNLEFFRDRAAFGWNFLFPFLIVAGFGIVFGGKSFSEYKAGVFPVEPPMAIHHRVEIPEGFQSSRYVEFVGIPSLEAGLALLKHHKIDLLIQRGTAPYAYWTNESSPKGYILEKMLIASPQPKDTGGVVKQTGGSGKGSPLYRLAVSRRSGHEHDVQRAVGGRVCGGPVPEKRCFKAPEGNAPYGSGIPQRPDALADIFAHVHPDRCLDRM